MTAAETLPSMSNNSPTWPSDRFISIGLKVVGLIGLLFFPIVLAMDYSRHRDGMAQSFRRTWEGWRMLQWFAWARHDGPRELIIRFTDGTRARWAPKDDVTPTEACEFAKSLYFAHASGIARRSEWKALQRHLEELGIGGST